MGSQPLDSRLHQACKMPLVAAPAASAAQATRKPSLKEQPSYLKEVSVALHRGEELKKLKERLSAAKLIMEKDPSAKPWMLSRSISNFSLGASLRLSPGQGVYLGNHPATTLYKDHHI